MLNAMNQFRQQPVVPGRETWSEPLRPVDWNNVVNGAHLPRNAQRASIVWAPKQAAPGRKRQIKLLPGVTFRAAQRTPGPHNEQLFGEAFGHFQAVALHAGGQVRIEACV